MWSQVSGRHSECNCFSHNNIKASRWCSWQPENQWTFFTVEFMGHIYPARNRLVSCVICNPCNLLLSVTRRKLHSLCPLPLFMAAVTALTSFCLQDDSQEGMFSAASSTHHSYIEVAAASESWLLTMNKEQGLCRWLGSVCCTKQMFSIASEKGKTEMPNRKPTSQIQFLAHQWRWRYRNKTHAL